MYLHTSFKQRNNAEGTSMDSRDFQASKVCFDKLRMRINLRNVKIIGEAASANNETAEVFPEILQKIIKKCSMLMKLHCIGRKCLNSYQGKSIRLQMGKDWVTIMLYANASGYMTKD